MMQAIDCFKDIRALWYGGQDDTDPVELTHGGLLEIEHGIGQVIFEVKIKGKWTLIDQVELWRM